jgi:CRP/FNR family transcriptional regulator, anaerobic regulatory protein
LDFYTTLTEAIASQGEEKIFSKGDLLIREGETERHVYLVQSGLVRVFLLTELEEQTIRFGYKGSVINSLASFLTTTPSSFYIEAIRKTVVRVITKDVFRSIVHADADSLNNYNRMLELLLVQQIDREIDLLTVSPTERLNRVLKRSPDLFQEVPLKYIANYLRMTPETLSRIRNS